MRGSNHDDDDDDRDNMLQDDETGVKSSGECDVQVKGSRLPCCVFRFVYLHNTIQYK